jgi:hypothetical protein
MWKRDSPDKAAQKNRGLHSPMAARGTKPQYIERAGTSAGGSEAAEPATSVNRRD